MGVKTKAQIGMDDTIVEDEELEALLEERQELKHNVSDYRQADKKAKAKIETIQTPLPYRVGRFIIARRTVPARAVSFETNENSSILIKTADED